METDKLSFVIGSFNRFHFLKQTVTSIRKEVSFWNFNYEIIIIDGGSTDGSIEFLSQQKDIILILQHNRGIWNGKTLKRRSWGYFMNLGFKVAEGKFICMLSDDCLLVPGSIQSALQNIRKAEEKGENVGACAFYWRNWPDEQTYKVGRTLGRRLFVNHGIFRKAALDSVGYVDEESFHFYHADGDLALKLWSKGYTVIPSPGSFVEHYMEANVKVRESNLKRQQEDWKTYLEKWKEIFYESEKFEGDWLYLNFVDPEKTYRRFLVAIPVFDHIFRFLKKGRNLLRDFIAKN